VNALEGKFKCSHAEPFIHGIYNLSRTDVKCQWQKWKATNTMLPLVREMFPSSNPAYNVLLREPTREDCNELYENLRNYGQFTGPYISRPLPVATIGKLTTGRVN